MAISRSAPPAGVFALVPGDGFTSAGAFDRDSTCDGAGDLSPGLSFHSVPGGTAELAVSMVDLDNGKVHWLQVAIPVTASGLVQHRLVEGAHELLNDLGEATYDGPCPPSGSTHRYELTLYALPAPFTTGAGAGEQEGARTVLGAIRSQAVASSSFTAAYTRGG
ncbi:MAG: YbhB/YbcL family Raf kinase inhibitor-like protein [Lapillicoccus sp.]